MESSANPVPQAPKAGDVIPDSYIIILKDGISRSALETHYEWVSGISAASRTSRGLSAFSQPFDYTYDLKTVKGYAGTFDKAIIDEIAACEEVDFVEPNTIVTTQGDGFPTDSDPQANIGPGRTVIQKDPPSWGLIPISNPTATIEKPQYVYDSSAGSGILTYVIDTGIRITHKQFQGRAKWGKNFVPGSEDTDRNGHGTHIGGTIVSYEYGVAKKATVIAVKVLGDNGSGSLASVIGGIDWVVRVAPRGKAVANISSGGGFSEALNKIVNAAVRSGLTIVVAAGYGNYDACKVSPASAEGAITVAATAKVTTRADRSNYGTCVNIFAPGTDITSCGIASDTATVEMSGTSMASAYVTGVAAYFIKYKDLTGPAEVRKALEAFAVRGVVKDPGEGSPNLFLNNGADAV